LSEQTGAVARVHGNDLNSDAAVIVSAANDAAAADLAYRKIQENLHQAAKGQGFLRAYEQTPDGKAFKERHATLRASLPGSDDTSGRTDARIFSLLGSAHCKVPGSRFFRARAGVGRTQILDGWLGSV